MQLSGVKSSFVVFMGKLGGIIDGGGHSACFRGLFYRHLRRHFQSRVLVLKFTSSKDGFLNRALGKKISIVFA